MFGTMAMGELLVILVVIGVVWALSVWHRSSGQEHVCRNCGYRGAAQTVTPGSFLIEVVLWLCFIIPGLLYSLWRHSRRHQACPSCHERGLIPASSPIGRELVNAHRK